MVGLLILIAHVVGALCALHAVMTNRTAQGAIAWSLGLFTFPYVLVPLYLVFGRQRFVGWVENRNSFDTDIDALIQKAQPHIEPFTLDVPARNPNHLALRAMAQAPFVTGNHVQLLIDGQATFDSIIEGIGRANDYVLVEFYIVRDDGLGCRLRDALVERARAGVRVFMLYDEVGSIGLAGSYLESLREAGVQVSSFSSAQGPTNRFQLNFRNHRKIVVVDGQTAWVGGHNVGDEYLGLDPDIGPWRDTHVRIRGPAALLAQGAFMADWMWAMRELPSLSWDPVAAPDGDVAVMVMSTGPADQLERSKLFYVHALNAAKERVWIATPYFVPDDAVASALRMAALRGLDVRIIVPKQSDNLVVDLATEWFIRDLDGVGIRFYRYREGFMHQKVLLADGALAMVGSANFDNRSFRLQFEANALIADPDFGAQVRDMLEADMARSEPYDPLDLDGRSFVHRLAVHLARLMAPLL